MSILYINLWDAEQMCTAVTPIYATSMLYEMTQSNVFIVIHLFSFTWSSLFKLVYCDFVQWHDILNSALLLRDSDTGR